jgi:hypothetical protein
MFCFKRKEDADGYTQKQLKKKIPNGSFIIFFCPIFSRESSILVHQKALIILCKSSDSCALVYAINFNKTAKTQAKVSDQVILTENKIESVN